MAEVDRHRFNEARDSLNKTSAALSQRVYVLNGAVLGCLWAFAVGDGLPLSAFSILSVCLSISVIAIDLAQMWAGYRRERLMLEAILEGRPSTAATSAGRSLRAWRLLLFDLKIGATVLSCVLFVLSSLTMLGAAPAPRV